MLIAGARIALDGQKTIETDVWLREGRISFEPPLSSDEPTLHLPDYLVLPGLINAHDHLDLNLFPRLGRGPYPNAAMWAADIYHPERSPVREHMAVPKRLRYLWSAVKSLVSGVTTVAHHNAPDPVLFDRAFPVNVVQRYGWAHSLRFSPDWLSRFRKTPEQQPFMIHAAEGCDEAATSEIHKLADASALSPRTVLVHGVALGPEETRLAVSKGASLVWCPSSNLFTLGRTVGRHVLHSELPICLGSDSALTAQGDLVDELRVASGWVAADRLFRMVTTEAASILKIDNVAGSISEGRRADLLVVRDTGSSPAQALLAAQPELVFVRGQLALIGANAARELSLSSAGEPFEIEERGTYRINFPVRELFRETRRYLPNRFSLAGKTIAA
jgi:cytosine/adenosine deaminase-related metal-dependent hydrolase